MTCTARVFPRKRHADPCRESGKLIGTATAQCRSRRRSAQSSMQFSQKDPYDKGHRYARVFGGITLRFGVVTTTAPPRMNAAATVLVPQCFEPAAPRAKSHGEERYHPETSSETSSKSSISLLDCWFVFCFTPKFHWKTGLLVRFPGPKSPLFIAETGPQSDPQNHRAGAYYY